MGSWFCQVGGMVQRVKGSAIQLQVVNGFDSPFCPQSQCIQEPLIDKLIDRIWNTFSLKNGSSPPSIGAHFKHKIRKRKAKRR